ncbi:MAG: ABC transporter permease, partial [Marinilabiliales bacterium]
SIKIKKENRDETLKFLEAKWYEFAGDDMPFRHDFVEDVISNSYNNDKRTATFIKYFTILSIIIASMGLLGLSILSIKQKTKEIGIRKVNGANSYAIIALMIKNYLVLVFVGFILSVPISYYFLQKWLNNFVYKTELSIWVFLIVILGLTVLTILTVGIATYNTANTNPADSLRYE